MGAVLAAVVEIVNEILAFAPQAIEAGISISSLWTKARAALDSVAAPGNPEWDAADKACNDLMSRALNKDTDNA